MKLASMAMLRDLNTAVRLYESDLLTREEFDSIKARLNLTGPRPFTEGDTETRVTGETVVGNMSDQENQIGEPEVRETYKAPSSGRKKASGTCGAIIGALILGFSLMVAGGLATYIFVHSLSSAIEPHVNFTLKQIEDSMDGVGSTASSASDIYFKKSLYDGAMQLGDMLFNADMSTGGILNSFVEQDSGPGGPFSLSGSTRGIFSYFFGEHCSIVAEHETTIRRRMIAHARRLSEEEEKVKEPKCLKYGKNKCSKNEACSYIEAEDTCIFKEVEEEFADEMIGDEAIQTARHTCNTDPVLGPDVIEMITQPVRIAKRIATNGLSLVIGTSKAHQIFNTVLPDEVIENTLYEAMEPLVCPIEGEEITSETMIEYVSDWYDRFERIAKNEMEPYPEGLSAILDNILRDTYHTIADKLKPTEGFECNVCVVPAEQQSIYTDWSDCDGKKHGETCNLQCKEGSHLVLDGFETLEQQIEVYKRTGSADPLPFDFRKDMVCGPNGDFLAVHSKRTFYRRRLWAQDDLKDSWEWWSDSPGPNSEAAKELIDTATYILETLLGPDNLNPPTPSPTSSPTDELTEEELEWWAGHTLDAAHDEIGWEEEKYSSYREKFGKDYFLNNNGGSKSVFHNPFVKGSPDTENLCKTQCDTIPQGELDLELLIANREICYEACQVWHYSYIMTQGYWDTRSDKNFIFGSYGGFFKADSIEAFKRLFAGDNEDSNEDYECGIVSSFAKRVFGYTGACDRFDVVYEKLKNRYLGDEYPWPRCVPDVSDTDELLVTEEEGDL